MSLYVRENRPSDVCPTKTQISMCIYAIFIVLMKNFESLAIQKVASKDSDQTVCLFVLRFYGPVNPMGSCWARSVYLTTRLLGRLSPVSGWPVLGTFFRQNWQLPFLNQRKGENDRRKYFMIKSDCMNVQSDLDLYRTHMSEVMFSYVYFAHMSIFMD